MLPAVKMGRIAQHTSWRPSITWSDRSKYTATSHRTNLQQFHEPHHSVWAHPSDSTLLTNTPSCQQPALTKQWIFSLPLDWMTNTASVPTPVVSWDTKSAQKFSCSAFWRVAYRICVFLLCVDSILQNKAAPDHLRRHRRSKASNFW